MHMMDANTDATTSTQQQQEQQQQQLHRNKTPNDLIQEINRLRRVVQIEKELTNSLQDVQPYILSSFRTMTHTAPKQNGWTDDTNNRNNNINEIPPDVFQLLQELNDKSRINNSSHLLRVRPIPRTMKQVHAILSLGRSYSNRTSAPAGWTSTTPLIHFTTPNPLPHQLRHSALATLQLQRAVEAAQAAARHERTRRQLQTTKRPIESISDTKDNNNNNDMPNVDDDMDTSMDVVTPNDDTTTTPKKPPRPSKVAAVSTLSPPPGRPRPPPKTTLLSMNLSDDDDDDDESSSDDDNE